MMRLRLLSLLVSTAVLAACGSKPVVPPPVVSNSQTFMATGMAAYNDNRYVEARVYFGRAFVQYRSVDDLEHEADALTDLADAAIQQGDTASAREQIRQARAVLAAHPVAGLPARLNLLEAYTDLVDRDPASAITLLDALLTDTTTLADLRRGALFARTQAAFDAKAGDANAWLAKLGTAQADLDQAAAGPGRSQQSPGAVCGCAATLPGGLLPARHRSDP